MLFWLLDIYIYISSGLSVPGLNDDYDDDNYDDDYDYGYD